MGNKTLIALIANWKINMGDEIAEGESFEVDSQKAADQLIESGAAYDPDATEDEVVVDPDAGDKNQPDPVVDPVVGPVVDPVKELTPEERAEKIGAVLDEMLVEDPKQENQMLWTKSNHPRNKAVDARVDFDAKNEEVLAIWESKQVTGDNA